MREYLVLAVVLFLMFVFIAIEKVGLVKRRPITARQRREVFRNIYN